MSSVAAPPAIRLWKTFRSKPNANPVAGKDCSACHRNRCSTSDRNAVRLHNGMAFSFRPESRSPSTGFPSSPQPRSGLPSPFKSATVPTCGGILPRTVVDHRLERTVAIPQQDRQSTIAALSGQLSSKFHDMAQHAARISHFEVSRFQFLRVGRP